MNNNQDSDGNQDVEGNEIKVKMNMGLNNNEYSIHIWINEKIKWDSEWILKYKCGWK